VVNLTASVRNMIMVNHRNYKLSDSRVEVPECLLHLPEQVTRGGKECFDGVIPGSSGRYRGDGFKGSWCDSKRGCKGKT
jgi:hypothetical protein